MTTVIIGHRGTGKSDLLKRWQLYKRDEMAEFIDLDFEIEKKIGKTIPELFLQHGEAYFRALEKQLFFEILQRSYNQIYIFVGAGFDLSVIPETVHVLWLKRKTDLDGRIFLNRPRLNPELAPLEEYKKRAQIREHLYRQRADESYLMPEGILENHHQALKIEKSILTHSVKNIGGGLTILGEVFLTNHRWNSFKQRYSNRGISFFELRDDLLTAEQIKQVMDELPKERFIYSFRKRFDESEFFRKPQNLEVLDKATFVDWAWELGAPRVLDFVPREKMILSLHDSVKKSEWEKYERSVGHLKYAPEVHNYHELQSGHQWQQENPSNRSFLPRSEQGQWEWYRLLQKDKQLLNFWREGDGSAGDQPSLFCWLMTDANAKEFAAVLGSPVGHSYTPLEQSDFFYKRGLPVLAINIDRNDWDLAVEILRAWGLTYAAVTSPHKENAARLCKHSELKAVNTLFWNHKKKVWLGTSTDENGFLELIEGIGMIAPLQKEIFVWGGGGTLEMLQKALPNARYFSSRNGKLRGSENDEEQNNLRPKIVIWAAPRSDETLMPSDSWQPLMVYDLNYKEDSMGREYAQKCGANYQSGLVMFKAQAQGQRLFWSRCEEKL